MENWRKSSQNYQMLLVSSLLCPCKDFRCIIFYWHVQNQKIKFSIKLLESQFDLLRLFQPWQAKMCLNVSANYVDQRLTCKIDCLIRIFAFVFFFFDTLSIAQEGHSDKFVGHSNEYLQNLWRKYKTIAIIFLFLHENIRCGYSLEVPQWGASNEYAQHMFS